MAAPETKSVVLEIPDMGLTDDQINDLKNTFHSHLVTHLGAQAATTVIVVIRVRIVRAI